MSVPTWLQEIRAFVDTNIGIIQRVIDGSTDEESLMQLIDRTRLEPADVYDEIADRFDICRTEFCWEPATSPTNEDAICDDCLVDTYL